MEAYVVLCCGYCGWCCNGHGMQISLPHPDLTSLGPLPVVVWGVIWLSPRDPCVGLLIPRVLYECIMGTVFNPISISEAEALESDQSGWGWEAGVLWSTLCGSLERDMCFEGRACSSPCSLACPMSALLPRICFIQLPPGAAPQTVAPWAVSWNWPLWNCSCQVLWNVVKS